MIRFRKPNRARDTVGAILLAVAATLLWVEASMAKNPVGSASITGDEVTGVAVIRSAPAGFLDSL